MTASVFSLRGRNDPLGGKFEKVACFGGIYSNYLALEVAIEDARLRGVERIFCLGDMGAFGPHPNRVFPLLREHNVFCLQGNYDDSIGNQLNDCQCGYTDRRDNYFAQISYDYTLANTSPDNREFLRHLPQQHRISLGDKNVLLCHGSPRRVNEFLWESTTSSAFLKKLGRESDADVIVGTHSGIKWQRRVDDFLFVNVGVLGRPENDGNTNVWYTILEFNRESNRIDVQFVPIIYDHERLASEMTSENLPNEFCQTVLTGWWTTCLEVLPVKERRRGQH